jgi:hypothetical protein
MSLASGTVSLLYRALVYSLLRVLPGRQGYFCYALFALYLAQWLYNDGKLRYIEDSPQRTMDKQSRKAKKRLAKAQAVVPAQTSPDSTKPHAPSYAAVAAAKAKPEPSSEKAPGSKLTTVDPPPELELRGVPVPGRTSVLSLLTGANSGSRVANRASLLINGLLLLACLDFQFAPIFFDQQKDLAFIRVGGVFFVFLRVCSEMRQASAILGSI